MIERRDRARFAFEACAPIGMQGNPFGENFNRDRAIEPSVPRLVDLSHAAGAKWPRQSDTGRGGRPCASLK